MEYISNRFFLIKKHSLIHRCISTIYYLCAKVLNNEKIFNNSIDIIIYHLFINGYCFIHKSNNKIINYDSVRIDENIYTFYYKNTHNTYYINDIHIIQLNLLGISPTDNALKHSEILNTIHEYLFSIVKNGGRPSGIFSVSQFTSDEQKVRTRESINTVLNNIGNKGLAAIVEGEYQWKNLGISPRELQILDIHNEQCKMICMCFQIPPIIMGFEDRIYNNNYKEARAQFIEDFIIPLTNNLKSQCT